MEGREEGGKSLLLKNSDHDAGTVLDHKRNCSVQLYTHGELPGTWDPRSSKITKVVMNTTPRCKERDYLSVSIICGYNI